MPKKLPDTVRERAIEMVERGKTYTEVGKALGVCKDTVGRWVKDYEIIKDKSHVPCLKKRRTRAVLLMAQGWKAEDAARVTDMDEALIRRNWRTWAEKYGIEIPKPLPPDPPPTHGKVLSYRIVNGQRVNVQTYRPYPRPPVHVDEEDMLAEYEPDVMRSDDTLYVKGAHRMYAGGEENE